MPPTASEIVQVTPSLLLWQTYDRAVKADLFSTALALQRRLVLVDPVRLGSDQLAELQNPGPIGSIVVTNANHHRAATWYSEQFARPILARRETFAEQTPDRFAEIHGGTKIDDEIDVIAVEGAPAGELALYHPADGGTLIVGDALINVEPYGFSLLPRKYCRNERQMRRSLRELLQRPTERIFFAHGAPIVADATRRLRQLLATTDG